MNATHEIVNEFSATELGLVQGSACALSRARFATTLTSNSGAAQPARVVNLDGTIEQSLNIEGWATEASARRRLWCGVDGRAYFAADPVRGAHQLRLIRWDTEGGSHNLVSIDLPWFEDGQVLGRTESLQQKPSSFLAEVRELNDHIVLLLIRTSDRRWTPARSRVEESSRHDTNYDVHYVVVDLVRREVLADSMVDKASEAIGQFIGPHTSSWAVDHETAGRIRLIERRIRLDSAVARE
ncbi:MAG: hypothetical protein IT353_14830 [Gemmatimonadaceae bacterium]|nr:hypothetical protein [Gemmatimonadaceae bacterium]